MLRFVSLAVAAFFAAGCGLGPGAALQGSASTLRQGTGTAGDRYLVKFRDGVSRSAQDLRVQKAGALSLKEIAPLGVRVVRTKQPGSLRGTDVEYIESDGLREIPEAAARLAARKAAGTRTGTKVTTSAAAGNRTSGARRAQELGGRPINDPMADMQWGLQAVNAGKAWERTMGSPDVIVAVVDTGVDLGHPDLRDRLVSGFNFVNEVAGASGEPGDTTITPVKNDGPMDDNGHGTHVAGIIAAQANNNEGIAGVAPNCRIMPVKVLAFNTRGFDGDVAAGIVYAVDHGARIVNMSLGGEGGSRTLERAVQYANSHGVLVVSAMGNDGEDPARSYGKNLNYPAAYDGVLAVAALELYGGVASYSNHGRWVSVAAPGSSILSTTPTYEVYDPMVPDYDRLSGTSMATPFVSGVAALLLSAQPHLSGREAKRILESTAQDVLFGGFDLSSGHGGVDAAAALSRR